ncbi:MAG: hypothetical protein ACRDHZ_00430 [Ktedonobacteraceae bacterium]
MIITLRSGLGKEISVYRSHVVPRIKEFIQVTTPTLMLFQVMKICYQVQGEESSSVDIEVLPIDEAARKHIQELFTLSGK